MSEIPKIKFNNGQECPVIGLGTWKSKPGEVTQAVSDAIDIGYRHFDCAHVYGNEKEVGEALMSKMIGGKVKREDLHITSKLWCTYHDPQTVEEAIKITLQDLGLHYLDLYLIHWPMSLKTGKELFPMGPDGKMQLSDHDYLNTWKAMEEVVAKGLTKSIGVSNFNKKQVERLLENSTIVPVTNQVECSPYLNQKELIEYCSSKDITITAYSPLGSPDRPNAKPGEPNLLDDQDLKTIAASYQKTPAQLALRYQVQRGLITIPKSVNKGRIAENFNIFDFDISKEDMLYLESFERNGRTCPFIECVNSPYYPFVTDEF